MEEPWGEAAPPWSGAALVTAARGVEALEGRGLVAEPGWRPGLDSLPALGSVWECEYYLDTGSRGARSLRGVEEGFVVKTSVYARCWRGGGLRERALYPLPRGAPHFLTLRGGDRLRQASTYIVEVASALALASGEARLPGEVDGWPRLVVRHGALLQQITGYLNEVYDMEPRMAEAVLAYAGLEHATIREAMDEATVERRGREVVNPGLLAAALLRRLRESVGGEASVAGVAEDVSRGRHLAVVTLARLLWHAARTGDAKLEEPVEAGLDELGDWMECLDDLDPDRAPGEDSYSTVERYARTLRAALLGGVLEVDGRAPPSRLRDAVRAAGELGLEEVAARVYTGQVLDRHLSIPNDAYYILAYNYLYGPEGLPLASPRHSKSSLVAGLYRANIESKGLKAAASAREYAEWIGGVEFRYVMPDRVPPCRILAERARGLGVDRRLLAELVKVKPPLRLEYFEGDPRRDVVDAKVYAASHITQYGVPAALLVVDSRSRVDEWDLGALRALLESQGRRLMPYSTFIRDFTARIHYM